MARKPSRIRESNPENTNVVSRLHHVGIGRARDHPDQLSMARLAATSRNATRPRSTFQIGAGPWGELYGFGTPGRGRSIPTQASHRSFDSVVHRYCGFDKTKT